MLKYLPSWARRLAGSVGVDDAVGGSDDQGGVGGAGDTHEDAARAGTIID